MKQDERNSMYQEVAQSLTSINRTQPSEEEMKRQYGKYWWKPSKYDDDSCLAISRADMIKRTGIYRLYGVSYVVKLLHNGFLGWDEIQEEYHKDLRDSLKECLRVDDYA